jgi:hypothetical protein
MVRRRRHIETRNETRSVDQCGVNRFRACLLGGIFVFLGLAFISAHWLPDEWYLEWIFIFFAAHSAATLALHEVRGYNDVEPS